MCWNVVQVGMVHDIMAYKGLWPIPMGMVIDGHLTNFIIWQLPSAR